MKSGIRRLLNALFYSVDGLKYAWINEQAFRQEVYVGIFILPIIFYLNESIAIKIILTFLYFCILIVELLNTAIESAINRISTEKHSMSKAAKDLGSAAVFVIVAVNLAAWIMIFYK